MSTCDAEILRRMTLPTSLEVPACLVTVGGEVAPICGNLSVSHDRMSRARKPVSHPTNPGQEPDPELASELRQRFGREWSEEAAEDERLTELLRRRRRSLAEMMADLAARGDRVSVEFGGHSFSGAVVASGEDYVTVSGAGQIADIRLDTAQWSVIPTGDATRSHERRAESFVAMLKVYEADGSVLRLALIDEGVVIGRIAVVAVDHVEVADVDDRHLYIPTPLILAVIRSTDFH